MYPGAALYTWIVGWAYDSKRLPSEVWEEYLDHQWDYQQLIAFAAWRAEQERKAYEEQKKKGRQRAPKG